jgi:hypothetical protein
VIRKLTFPGCHGGKRRRHLGDALAAAVRACNATLFEIGHMEILVEFFFAILAEKHVVRHPCFPPLLVSYITPRAIVASRIVGKRPARSCRTYTISWSIRAPNSRYKKNIFH